MKNYSKLCIAAIQGCYFIHMVDAKRCWYQINGANNNFYCSPFEHCCGSVCCQSVDTFYRVWYFWFCVLLALLFCSGGGYYYRRRYYQQRIIGSNSSRVLTAPTLVSVPDFLGMRSFLHRPRGTETGTNNVHVTTEPHASYLTNPTGYAASTSFLSPSSNTAFVDLQPPSYSDSVCPPPSYTEATKTSTVISNSENK